MTHIYSGRGNNVPLTFVQKIKISITLTCTFFEFYMYCISFGIFHTTCYQSCKGWVMYNQIVVRVSIQQFNYLCLHLIHVWCIWNESMVLSLKWKHFFCGCLSNICWFFFRSCLRFAWYYYFGKRIMYIESFY